MIDTVDLAVTDFFIKEAARQAHCDISVQLLNGFHGIGQLGGILGLPH